MHSIEPHAHSASVNLSDVTLTEGFWKQRTEVNRKVSIPYLYELAANPDKGHVIRNFEIAAGLSGGEHAGTDWQDAWAYKWIEAASYSLVAHPDQELEARIDSLAGLIARAQEEDGYIATQVSVKGEPRYNNPHDHEFYTMGHLMTAAAVHHRITGKKELLQVAGRCADYMYRTVSEDPDAFALFPYNPSMIMGAVELYRITGMQEHLDLAELLIDLRGSTYDGNPYRSTWKRDFYKASDQNQNFKPLLEEKEVLGHAVFYTYLYAGAADAYMENGDTALLRALDRLWQDLVDTKLYFHGGSGAEHKALVSRPRPDGRRDFVMANPIHEGIAMPFELPSKTAYNETCGQIGIFMWNWRMLQASGNPKYAEIMERTLYNSVLSGVELDGDGWYYTNVLSWDGPDHMMLNKDAHKRYDPGRGDICCPTNLLRTVASYQGYMYAVSDRALWLHHYAASHLDTDVPGYGRLRLAQKTGYPWDGAIVLEITEAQRRASCDLNIRIPEWAHGATIGINGEQQASPAVSSYVTLTREWKKGDRITIDLPMEVTLYRASPKVEHLLGQVAVKRGPLVYCLESIDLERDVPIESIHLPLNSEWQLESDPGVLDGAVRLSATAYEVTSTSPTGSLYTELGEVSIDPVGISMIPYFAWNNRQEPKMRIWLPLFIGD